MSMKLMLSAAALVALGATSAMAAPAFVASPYCDQAVSRQACGNHMIYLESLRTRHDSSLSYMENLIRARIRRCVMQAVVVAAVAVAVAGAAADNQHRSRTAWRRITSAG